MSFLVVNRCYALHSPLVVIGCCYEVVQPIESRVVQAAKPWFILKAYFFFRLKTFKLVSVRIKVDLNMRLIILHLIRDMRLIIIYLNILIYI